MPRAVFAVVSTTKMQEHAGSDKSCVWHAADFADGELKEEMFAIRFGSIESEFFYLLVHSVSCPNCMFGVIELSSLVVLKLNLIVWAVRLFCT